MSLVADLVEDGQTADNEREGNEEEMKAYMQELTIDLLTHSVKNKGKMADQKTVIQFREHARDKLSYWLANRIDQLVFLTLSGISYAYNCDGSARSGSNLINLSFAGNVTAPTTKRRRLWTGTALTSDATSALTTSSVPSYKMFTQAVAYAKDHYIKPLMAGGREYYLCLVKPGTLAQLKGDDNFQRALTTAAPRGLDNPWFTGATVTMDGIVFHEHRLVYSTTGTATKWGSGNAINGTRTLMLGSQALGMADLGTPEWCEKLFDYDSKVGINVDKMFGLLKPVFRNVQDGTDEDFGVLAIDHYLPS